MIFHSVNDIRTHLWVKNAVDAPAGSPGWDCRPYWGCAMPCNPQWDTSSCMCLQICYQETQAAPLSGPSVWEKVHKCMGLSSPEELQKLNFIWISLSLNITVSMCCSKELRIRCWLWQIYFRNVCLRLFVCLTVSDVRSDGSIDILATARVESFPTNALYGESFP